MKLYNNNCKFYILNKPILVVFVALCALLLSCGKTADKKTDQNPIQESSQKATSNAVTPSADYSSLFINYECDLTATEVAKIFEIPESDVTKIEIKGFGRCDFEIKGFGKNAMGGTMMHWGHAQSTKANNLKEIQSFLKDQENNESMFGMGIEKSATGDCYIVRTPHVGRVIIYNENYDNAFYFEYSQRGIYKRTAEQHEALEAKTIALANYLLKKHRK